MTELAVIGRRLSEPRTGFGRYLEMLLRHWSQIDTTFDRIRTYVTEDPNLPTSGKLEFEIIPQHISPLFWENLQLPSHLRRANLIFGAYTLPWREAHRGVVSNLGIYDSRPSDFSRLARLKTTPFYKHSARKALRVIANSASTRKDLIRYHQIDPKKIDVVLLGADERLSPGPSNVADKPFFLLVGKLSQRRNIPLLIEAFSKVTDHNLIIIGPDYQGLDIEYLARRHQVADRIRHIEHVGMDQLADYYRGATAFVLPTLHEGFSLTIIEAMACGTPAIVFDHAALEGPVRDALLFSDPTAEALTAAMTQIALDPELRRDLSRRSIAAAKHYSWRQTAEQTIRILESAAGL